MVVHAWAFLQTRVSGGRNHLVKGLATTSVYFLKLTYKLLSTASISPSEHLRDLKMLLHLRPDFSFRKLPFIISKGVNLGKYFSVAEKHIKKSLQENMVPMTPNARSLLCQQLEHLFSWWYKLMNKSINNLLLDNFLIIARGWLWVEWLSSLSSLVCAAKVKLGHVRSKFGWVTKHLT